VKILIDNQQTKSDSWIYYEKTLMNLLWKNTIILTC